MKKDIEAIENVQRRATKLLPNMSNLSYQQRLQRLQLPTLSYRRLRGSMIEVYKIFHIYDKGTTPLLKLSTAATRGHKYKLALERSKKYHPKQHFFNQRVVNPWNNLPDYVVDSPTLKTFESRLDSHWRNLPLKFDHTSYFAPS